MFRLLGQPGLRERRGHGGSLAGLRLDAGVAGDVVREALQGLPQAGPAERRAVQVADQRTNEIVRAGLGLADKLEVLLDVSFCAVLEVPLRDVNLERQPEQELREVVV